VIAPLHEGTYKAKATHNGYFELRAELLGGSRTRVLDGSELVAAGRLIYGRPEGFAVYGVPSPQMAARGLRLLGRTTIECSVDTYVMPIADLLADADLGVPIATGGFVADLFCGSGNIGFHLGRRLGKPVYASELDPAVYAATRHNIDVLGIDVELNLMDYRDLLGKLPTSGDADVYVVEPPWGPAFTANGLDLACTTPPIPEILRDILRSRQDRPCVVVIKTNDQIANDSLALSFRGARHLATVTPPPALPVGANMDFHLYLLGSR
jgi:Conserved hypothetical protein 95